MASSFVQKLMGESTTTGDIAPVETGAPLLSNPSATGAKRKIPTMNPNDKKKLRNRMVDQLMGIKEDRDGSVIPDDAKEVQTVEKSDHGLNLDVPKIPGEKIRNPYSGEEPLILPAASLVAPDVTPEGIFPLDPAQLPGADQGKAPAAPVGPPAGAPPASTGHEGDAALKVLLGKPAAPAASGIAGPTPASATTSDKMSTESAMSHLPGIPTPGAVAAATTPGATGDALLSADQPMPDHQQAGIEGVMETYSKFIPRGSMKLRE